MLQENPSPTVLDDAVAVAQARREAYNQRRLRRLKIIFPFLLVLVFLVYAFTTNFIPSESMQPTLNPGDHILTMRSWLAYPGGRMPARGDIIVFKLPKSVEQNEDNGNGNANASDSDPGDSSDSGSVGGLLHKPTADILIKRVVGLPGETVQVRGNDVYVNGKKIEQDYKIIPVDDPDGADFPFAVDQPLKVPPGQLFLLGDNRNNSDDGRFWGTLKREDVIGKYIRTLWNEGQNGPNEKRAAQDKASDSNQ
jgi:signal peptidase I